MFNLSVNLNFTIVTSQVHIFVVIIINQLFLIKIREGKIICIARTLIYIFNKELKNFIRVIEN